MAGGQTQQGGRPPKERGAWRQLQREVGRRRGKISGEGKTKRRGGGTTDRGGGANSRMHVILGIEGEKRGTNKSGRQNQDGEAKAGGEGRTSRGKAEPEGGRLNQ